MGVGGLALESQFSSVVTENETRNHFIYILNYKFMKVSLKLGIIAMLFILGSFVACQKEQTNVVTPTVAAHSFNFQNVEVVDGRLVFKTKSDLNTLLDEMFKNQNSLENFDKHFKGFTSQFEVYNRFSDEDLVKTNGDLTSFKDYVVEVKKADGIHLERVVSEPLAARLVNSEGLIQIGDVVSKMTRDYAYQFPVSNLESYKNNTNSLERISNLEKKKIERITQDIDVSGGLSTRGYIVSAELVYQYKSGKQFRKVRGELEATDPLLSSWRTAYARVKHEKRGFWGSWSNEATDQLRISGVAHLEQLLPPGTGWVPTIGSPFTLNQTNYNTSEFAINIATNDGAQTYGFTTGTSVDFRAYRLDGGGYATCNAAQY